MQDKQWRRRADKEKKAVNEERRGDVRRGEERREEGVQRMKCCLQTIHLLPNTPCVIENDNNAARAPLYCRSQTHVSTDLT